MLSQNKGQRKMFYYYVIWVGRFLKHLVKPTVSIFVYVIFNFQKVSLLVNSYTRPQGMDGLFREDWS